MVRFTLAGVVCGLFAVLFASLVLRVRVVMSRARLALHWRPLLAGLFAGGLALLMVPDKLGVSQPILDRAVLPDTNHDAVTAAVTLVVKLLATVACRG